MCRFSLLRRWGWRSGKRWGWGWLVMSTRFMRLLRLLRGLRGGSYWLRRILLRLDKVIEEDEMTRFHIQVMKKIVEGKGTVAPTLDRLLS